MVSLGEDTIIRFKQFTLWTDTLYGLQGSIWSQPIAEGKATVGEIIAHLQHWDEYIITKAIPAIKRGEGMAFPDFDPFNQAAYAYARSGISQKRLLDEFKQTRLQLVDMLIADYETTVKPVTVNGAANCPHTGTPYSLLYIIHEFTDHDRHHQEQIIKALA